VLSRKLILLFIAVFVLLSFSFVVSVEADSLMWSQTYVGTGGDDAYSLIETSDGGYAIAGYFDYGSGTLLVKTDAYGYMEWNKTYGGGICNSLVETLDGGYAIGGTRKSDFWLVKTDGAGNVEWNKTYGGTKDEHAWSLVATSDGGYAIAGETGSFGTGGRNVPDFWLIKTDAFGNMEWNKTYGGTGMEEARSVVETSDGGYAIAGNTDNTFWLVKTDASGNMEWNKIYSGSHWTPLTMFPITCSMVATADGGYALAGYVTSFGAEYNDFWLIKTDAYGNMEWNRTYGGTAHSLIQTSDGGYALAGYTNAGGTHSLLVKTDELGYMEWNQTYELGSSCNSLIVTSDGGYALAGSTFSSGLGNSDFLLIKTDEYGVVPEYSSWLLTSLLLTATLFIVIYKKKFFDDHP